MYENSEPKNENSKNNQKLNLIRMNTFHTLNKLEKMEKTPIANKFPGSRQRAKSSHS